MPKQGGRSGSKSTFESCVVQSAGGENSTLLKYCPSQLPPNVGVVFGGGKVFVGIVVGERVNVGGMGVLVDDGVGLSVGGGGALVEAGGVSVDGGGVLVGAGGVSVGGGGVLVGAGGVSVGSKVFVGGNGVVVCSSEVLDGAG